MTSANYHYIALHARLQGVVITVWERGQKVKCQSALSWNTESNDGACVLEERSRCGVGGDARRGTAQSQSHFWVEILSKQMLTGRLQVHSKVRRHKHLKKPSFWQLDTRQGCVAMKQGARLSAPLEKPNISPILPYSSLWLITLLLSFAFELLISLFVKMTLAGSMCSVPLSLSMEVSYPPLSSSGSVEADITLTAVTALL